MEAFQKLQSLIFPRNDVFGITEKSDVFIYFYFVNLRMDLFSKIKLTQKTLTFKALTVFYPLQTRSVVFPTVPQLYFNLIQPLSSISNRPFTDNPTHFSWLRVRHLRYLKRYRYDFPRNLGWVVNRKCKVIQGDSDLRQVQCPLLV